MIGTRSMMNQAPPVNLKTPITMVTTPVVKAPRPFTNRPSRQPCSLSLMCFLAMPACESVNEVNTPMA